VRWLNKSKLLLLCLLLNIFSNHTVAQENCTDNSCTGRQACLADTDAGSYCEIDPATIVAVKQIIELTHTMQALNLIETRNVTPSATRPKLVEDASVAFDISSGQEGLYNVVVSTTDTSGNTASASVFIPRYVFDEEDLVTPVTIAAAELAINEGAWNDITLGEELFYVMRYGTIFDRENLVEGHNLVHFRADDSAGSQSPVVAISVPVYPFFDDSIVSRKTVTLVEGFYDSPDPGNGNASPLSAVNNTFNGDITYTGPNFGMNVHHNLVLRAIDSTDQSAMVAIGFGLIDSDGDTIADQLDAFPNSVTEFLDTDGDGIGNNSDDDDDGDSVKDVDDKFVLDATESVDTDNDGIGNVADLDDDGDGLPDTYEAANNLQSLVSNAGVDTDGDGVSDVSEYLLQTNPTNADSDDDGLSDGDEIAAGLDPLVVDEVSIAEQLLTAAEQTYRVQKDNTVIVSWSYTTSDDWSELEGLSLRIHFNNSILRWDAENNLLNTGFVSISGVLSDSSDFDNDATTTHFVEVVWQDQDDMWPGTLPSDLIQSQFTLVNEVDTFAFSSINLTASTNPERIEGGQRIRYRLTGDSIRVGLAEAGFTLDVNGDGEFDAFVDGFIISRYLLGFPAETIAKDSEMIGATRTREEMYQMLEAAKLF
jgi:hypothetical protein